jgi:RNA polymerase sigma factor (sigma-70 family)
MAKELRITSVEKKKSEYVYVKRNSEHLENDETSIWQSFIKGSESAFIALYKKYFQILYNYGRQLSGDTDLIKDCIQETFISLRKNRKNLAAVLSPKAYLLKAIRNKILKELKNNKRRSKYFLMDSPLDFQIEPSMENLIIERQFKAYQLKKINRALNDLSRRQREAIFYYYYNDLSYKEIKEVMGFSSTEAARNLIYRALIAIKKSINLK